jgi:hypothetical protein
MNAMMKADVLVQPITLRDIRPLFPLMQAVEPGLQLSAWLTYAKRMTKPRAGHKTGIAVARRRGQIMPCGAVCYRLDRDLRFGSLLTAEHVVALDLLYPQAVLTALFDALDDLAAEFRCSAIRSIVHDNRPDVLENLRNAGHCRDGMTLTKSFRSAPQ